MRKPEEPPEEPHEEPNRSGEASGPESPLQEGMAPESLQERLPDLSESVDGVRRARAGDQEALDRLLLRYRERLERIVRIELGANLGRVMDPDDIFQEVCLVVQRRIHEFELRSHSGFLAWLVTIAKRKVKDEREKMEAEKRDKKREVPLTIRGPDSGASSVLRPLARSSIGPATHAERVEFRELMDQTLTELPADYCRIITLRDYYGAEWDEIEQELDRKKHACEQLYQRAWIRLKLEVMKKLRNRQPPP